MKTLKLQELNEPNLLEGLFPHVAPPRIDFAETISEQELADLVKQYLPDQYEQARKAGRLAQTFFE